jgi:hypothetical protein
VLFKVDSAYWWFCLEFISRRVYIFQSEFPRSHIWAGLAKYNVKMPCTSYEWLGEWYIFSLTQNSGFWFSRRFSMNNIFTKHEFKPINICLFLWLSVKGMKAEPLVIWIELAGKNHHCCTYYYLCSFSFLSNNKLPKDVKRLQKYKMTAIYSLVSSTGIQTFRTPISIVCIRW